MTKSNSNSQVMDPKAIKFDKNIAWGLSCCVDLCGCDLEIMSSAEKLAQYVVELCELIDMKRFGDPTIVNFGDDPRVSGYTLVQLIETSSITGHFANNSLRSYLDVFSCKEYDPEVVAEFSKKFFKADSYELAVTLRV